MDFDEPLHHSLLRDAIENVNTNSKHSLLLAIIALEVGIKDFISKTIPQASWIVFNLQTPPLDKILEDYLHKINPIIIFETKHLVLIKLLINKRNELSHRGTLSIQIPKLYEGLYLIKEILYLFDYIRGHNWAINHLNILRMMVKIEKSDEN